MRAQATIEGIEHVVRRDSSGLYERPSAMTASSGEVIVAERVGETEPVRIEPVRWSVIVGGAFVTFTSLGLLAMLATTLGLPPFLPNALRIEPYPPAVAPLVAALVALLGFGLGGWVASRLSVVHTLRTALLSGALVWAVCVPVVASGMAALNALGDSRPTIIGRGLSPRLESELESGGDGVLSADRLQFRAGAGLLAIVVGFGGSVLGGAIGAGRREPAPRRLHDSSR